MILNLKISILYLLLFTTKINVMFFSIYHYLLQFLSYIVNYTHRVNKLNLFVLKIISFYDTSPQLK